MPLETRRSLNRDNSPVDLCPHHRPLLLGRSLLSLILCYLLLLSLGLGVALLTLLQGLRPICTALCNGRV